MKIIYRVLIPSILLLALFLAPLHAQGRDQIRVQQHLQKAEAFMRQNDANRTIPLAPPQKIARETHLERLAEYRKRGVFPHNHHALGALPTPIFRDKDGTLCAMGYLIWESGQHEMVEDVVQSRNLGYLHEIATDARLKQWLKNNGLTLEEAARIQPTYGFDNNTGSHHDYNSGDMGALSILFITAHSVLSLSVNHLIHDRYTRNFRGNWGIASGFLTKAVGIGVLGYGKEGLLPGLLVFGIGSHTYKMGQHAFREGRKPDKLNSSLTITPTLDKKQGKNNLGVMASFSLSL
jgi:hypothetical protein